MPIATRARRFQEFLYHDNPRKDVGEHYSWFTPPCLVADGRQNSDPVQAHAAETRIEHYSWFAHPVRPLMDYRTLILCRPIRSETRIEHYSWLTPPCVAADGRQNIDPVQAHTAQARIERAANLEDTAATQA